MDVAHIEEFPVRPVLRTAVAAHHKHMILGRESDGDGVVKRGRSGVGAPVHGIDGNARRGNDRLHVLHILHRIVADSDTRIVSTTGRTDVMAHCRVPGRHLITHHIGGSQLCIGVLADMLEQFHNSFAALTEACNDKRTALVATALEEVESSAHITHGQAGAAGNGVLVLRQPRLHGGVAVEGRAETVAGSHIGRNAQHLPGHMLAMHGVPHVGIVAEGTVGGGPVLLPRGHNIEDVGSGARSVTVGNNPHHGVAIVGCLRDIPGIGSGHRKTAAPKYTHAAEEGKDDGRKKECQASHRCKVSGVGKHAAVVEGDAELGVLAVEFVLQTVEIATALPMAHGQVV